MPFWLEVFLLTFIPLFIVTDPLGNLPFVITLSEGLSKRERRRFIHIATLTAFVVGLVFLFFGRFILDVLGISFGSFAIAGGLILLVLSIRYMISGHIVELMKEDMSAAVPIGTPLISGPATITTLLLLTSQFSIYTVLISFVCSIIVTWVIFMLSNYIVRFMGQGGLKAVSKVFSLLLAAIAVSIIIQGLKLTEILQ